MGRAKVSRYPRLKTQSLNGPVIVRRATVEEFPQLGERYAPRELRLRILRRDGFRCRYCRAPVTMETANIDHVRPWKRGGMTVEANLVAACRECNRKKGNRAKRPVRLSKMVSSSAVA